MRFLRTESDNVKKIYIRAEAGATSSSFFSRNTGGPNKREKPERKRITNRRAGKKEMVKQRREEFSMIEIGSDGNMLVLL